jgi:hypothetical protein
MARQELARSVDHTALRVNQAFIIALLTLAFVFDSWIVAAFVAAVMLIGTVSPSLALIKQLYLRVLKPRGVLEPDVVEDNPEPHRFAQGFGGVVVSLGVLALLLGATVLGWALAWVVIILAALNLFLGFCAGCFVYYQLNKLNIPGFEHGPVGQ